MLFTTIPCLINLSANPKVNALTPFLEISYGVHPGFAEDAELTVEKTAVTPDAPAPDTVGIPGDDKKETAEAPAAEKTEDKAEASAAPAVEAAEEYVVQKGDTISKIAQKFYGDGRKYMPIIKANEVQLKGNPNRIYPGMKLSIPKF